MARLRGYFEGCVLDSQNFGSTDDHMVSRAFFVLEREGSSLRCFVDVTQPHRTTYNAEPVEVGPPKTRDGGTLDGSWNHKGFRDLVESYYRGMIATGPTAISAENGRPIPISNVRMRNITMAKRQDFELDVPDFLPGSW